MPVDAVGLLDGWQRLAMAISGVEQAEDTPAQQDDAFVDLLRRGDHDAWRRLFEEESPALYRYALSRLGSPEDAEEVTNHVFSEAWRNANRYRDQGLPVRAWLFGIARRLASRHRARFMSRNAQVSIEALQIEGISDVVSEEQMALAQAMASLEPAYAEVLSLRFVHGLSLAETAAVLKTSVDAVKGRQKRALEVMRQRMEPEQHGRSG